MKKIINIIKSTILILIFFILLIEFCFGDIHIKYLGHSCFYINFKDNNNQNIMSILIDPYSYELSYPYLKDFEKTNEFKNLNYIISSHTHFDHFNENIFKLLKSKYIKGADDNNWYPFYLENNKIKIYNFGIYHDENLGKDRGKNSITVIESNLNNEKFKLVHLGDIGHLLNENTNYINKKNFNINEIKNCDILFIPVGGYFTIDINKINELIGFINPKSIIPMHYKNKYIPDFPISNLNDFFNNPKIKEKLKEFKIVESQNSITIKNKITQK
ncbi:MAG: MBL fold metallo-hydrolase, partial [bacterium]